MDQSFWLMMSIILVFYLDKLNRIQGDLQNVLNFQKMILKLCYRLGLTLTGMVITLKLKMQHNQGTPNKNAA